ncbi:2-phosphosulfolactate phosphatase family protein [Heliobacterium gestii]|uniref:Probable 2-phosphosulfolactate phosphatase n=1 Tax=Heliomicrobium gestii TaxID=2699 RepID=A0A845LBJ3_HELGE|nr:2-phosphosulfolactate phosphatase [Heliomicrobium gestii]MBM7867774.1 2-phosphosulfolactate phosphatase [Heliomicrobium gestii]MZP44167.1 2-phosphosulfolactate phosphatase family protein [Heliomicrobium gestii]
MYVEVIATHQNVTRDELEGRYVIVIDTLRATSTIVTALAHGCKQVFPVANLNEARVLASSWDSDKVLLGGEGQGRPLPGVFLGNSPRDYTAEVVGGKTLFLVTTNGTVALQKAQKAAPVLVGSLLNGETVARRVLHDDPDDLVILCAGTQGYFALEDIVTAGKIIGHIWESRPAVVNELAIAAFQLYQFNQQQLPSLMAQTIHGRRLVDMGDGDDLRFCLQEDIFPLLAHQAVARVCLLTPEPALAQENNGSRGSSWHGTQGRA